MVERDSRRLIPTLRPPVGEVSGAAGDMLRMAREKRLLASRLLAEALELEQAATGMVVDH